MVHAIGLIGPGPAWPGSHRCGPAAIVILMVQKNPGREFEIARLLRRRAHHINPNSLMIEIAEGPLYSVFGFRRRKLCCRSSVVGRWRQHRTLNTVIVPRYSSCPRPGSKVLYDSSREALGTAVLSQNIFPDPTGSDLRRGRPGPLANAEEHRGSSVTPDKGAIGRVLHGL
jgi:hypothetical protein